MRGNPLQYSRRHNRQRSIPACAGEPWTLAPWSMAPGVYPRVCGGTQLSHQVLPTAWGLSPRVRGNLALSGLAADGLGSIPACAGEPPAAIGFPRRLAVYPRVCGGTNDLIRTQPGYEGLSPRVRGNLIALCQYPRTLRSIPACAGEPPSCWCRPYQRQVYPRVCGGTKCSRSWCIATGGLSPRVRGNLSGQ